MDMSKEGDSGTQVGDAPAVDAAASRSPKPASRGAPSSQGVLGRVIVNVRFYPTGLVNTITNIPGQMSAQSWFDHLCRTLPDTYRPLSGGRGSFAIDADDFATAMDAIGL
jgi:hypothetical protein